MCCSFEKDLFRVPALHRGLLLDLALGLTSSHPFCYQNSMSGLQGSAETLRISKVSSGLWVHKSCTSSPVPGILASCCSLNSQSLLYFWDHKHSLFCHWAQFVWTSAQMLPLQSRFLNTSSRGQHPTHHCIAHFIFLRSAQYCLP